MPLGYPTGFLQLLKLGCLGVSFLKKRNKTPELFPAVCLEIFCPNGKKLGR